MIYNTLRNHTILEKKLVHHVSFSCITIVYNKISSVFVLDRHIKNRLHSGLTYFTTNPQVQYNLLNMTIFFTDLQHS